MLSIIEEHLLDEGIECMTIRGDVKPLKRNEYVEIFNSSGGPKVVTIALIIDPEFICVDRNKELIDTEFIFICFKSCTLHISN